MKALTNNQYFDLVLRDVIRPYQNMIGYEKRVERLHFQMPSTQFGDFNYFDLQKHCFENKEWFETVLNRMSRIYEKIDYSFFPEGDWFADHLKCGLLSKGVKNYNPLKP
mgnify:CR=1 FL=1